MAKRRYLLAIDQGTTGTHVLVVDDRLEVVGEAYREFTQHFPKAGWVEHDLREIWKTVERCCKKGLADADIRPDMVTAIGITNQRETTAVWNRSTGEPLARAIVWQDRRTADMCAELKARGEEARVRETTGLVLDPYFSATKLRWMLDHVDGLRGQSESGKACFGTIDSWLVFRLTGGARHVTDASNASRTLLYDLRGHGWSEDMLELFGIPPQLLPEIRSCAEVYGKTKGMDALPDGIPISGMAGDQQAALFGQACFRPGESKCTYGTGSFLLMNTGTEPVPSKTGLLSTVAWQLGDTVTYALEGSSFVAGAAVQWLRDGLQAIKKSAQVEKLARSVDSSGEVVFVPALSGLGAPHWRPDARGLLMGLDRSTNLGHVARAVLEGIALQTYELTQAMTQDSGQPIPVLKVDGGASANDLLMQYQADILGVPVVRPRNLQTTAAGAAFLAGIGAGVWGDPEEIRGSWRAEKTFKPKMDDSARAHALEKWKRAVERA
ncbi:MAG TPA: glycerol kinase GlpK [Myxococcaceae bacterium]|nr:glycerol kinase GlpK [Myxococcaceae bacterium]